ncbi:MAG TPA: peptidoglycan DD-metalloendopeptidase family protein [Actinomycetes bacterium]|nr:peptidoglycan DD-metalloendopeptidase family protein [Actinomycetes bacterium]
MRAPLAVVAAVSTACAVVVAGAAGSANAGIGVPTPTVTPLPSVSVPLPQPTSPVPLPSAPLPDPGQSLPGTGALPGTGGGGGTDGSGGSGGSSGDPDATATGPGSTGAGATAGPAGGAGAAAAAGDRRRQRAADTTPLVAGTPAARDLLDDESSPQLLAASEAFLDADRRIAEIARQKRLMAQLKQAAAETAQVYRALDFDVLTARTTSTALRERYESVRRQLVASAREAYVTGQPTTDDGQAAGMAAAVDRLGDGSARAEIRVGTLTVRRDTVRAEFEAIATRYREAQRRLDDANRELRSLAAQRSDALQDVRAAKGSDVALHRARMIESGQLGAQIREASAALERAGRTVQGTGTLGRPVAGHVTSPFGMRVHPILRHTKLHTGTDFAGGSPAILAADDGRVLMTVTSTAYGNFTVIDHGVVDGKRLTTAYAHQAQFLVAEGDAVRKGQQIGVVGSTGYSTGPHLHFEVREDGTVVDPMRYLG